MKIEFTSLESEPLLYFLQHSGAFVVGMGVVFFLLGMVFGALTWGRHRRFNQRLRAEGITLREEVAGLKRKLAEQNLRPSTAPLPAAPTPALLTEVLPTVSDIFPERAVTQKAEATKPVDEVQAIPSLPFLPEPLFVDPAPEAKPSLPPVQRSSPPAKRIEEDSVTPFSFLLPESPEDVASDSGDDASFSASDPAPSLSEIIAPAATIKVEEASATPSDIPENDPVLGMIFKEAPLDQDDLTCLDGVSPALQSRLQELGVYQFQQIAAWNPSQVREFSHRLAFKDRIEREHWVDQARRLMAGEMA